MTEVVLDASVAITFALRQRGAADVDRRLERWLGDGTELAVPSHFWLEVSNALLRRHRRTGRQVVETIHHLDELRLDTIPVDRPLLLLAVDRAERFGLTLYDAAYLALAETLDASLYSSDRELLAAAGSRALPVVGTTDHRLSDQPAAYGGERRPTWPDYSGTAAYLAKLRSEATRTA
ncbi:MAG TPA: type II toxin-antitoxin system VapC family toxin [Candidatus Limnocylindrales bacterium]|nr:type II toxin-antitoxin system VapC family toxin [Candidatus Limnocylindrales bacterium]